MSIEAYCWATCGLQVATCVIAVWGMRRHYRAGIVDGYGYSKEPGHPAAKYAGEYLKKSMSKRWPELSE